MSIYNINNDMFERKGNNGGPPKLSINQKITALSSIDLVALRDGVTFLRELVANEGKNVFRIKYNKIPPKSNRFELRKNIINVDMIPQKGIKTFIANDQLFTNLYYDLTNNEVNSFINDLDYLLSNIELFRNSIDDDSVDWLFFKKASLVRDISIENNPSSIIAPITLRIIVIPEIIIELRNYQIIRDDNYFEESNMISVTPEEYVVLMRKFPYIIIDTLQANDISIEIQEFPIEQLEFSLREDRVNDQLIGVIDSGIDPDFPFSEKVISSEDHREFGEFHDYKHGSMVSSIIIANDELNPGHMDNLGNFRIKHFEVLEPSSETYLETNVSFIHLYKKIDEIVSNNTDIKVWNLSLGGPKIPFTIMMSPLAVLLDKLSFVHNVLFCVASGNDRARFNRRYWESLNQPADSLNSLSVGSVTNTANEGVTFAPYSSIGPVLHFEKPEVSEWGGGFNKDGSLLKMMAGNLVFGAQGTSFSTPRISRLAAHFIQEGLSPQEAKAKIISLATRETPSNKSSSFGYVNGLTSSFDLKTTMSLSDNIPIYLPINLVDGIEKIIVTTTHKAKPNPNLGEEYCIFDISGSLIWYDHRVNNPEYALRGGSKSVQVPKDNTDHNDKPTWEHIERFDGGKYFTSHKKTFYINKIMESKNKCINLKNVDGPNLAIRLKKLSLFSMAEEPLANVSIVVSFIGSFNHDDFYSINENIIDIEINQEITN